MTFKLVQKDICVFHITHIKNLPGILSRGILCPNELKRLNLQSENISYDDIQAVRAIKPVLDKHTLHDYVPCFFGARPPMLLAVKGRGYLEEIIYVFVDWKILALQDTCFTDGNARDVDTNFFSSKSQLNQIDFDAAGAWYWGDKGVDYKRKKQAEVLRFKCISIEEILGLGVYNTSMETKVKQILSAQNLDKKVLVVPEFYYS